MNLKDPWIATGWRGRTVLVYSLFVAAGFSGHVQRRHINAPWYYRTASGEAFGPYRTCDGAIRACERALRSECHAALRALRRPKP